MQKNQKKLNSSGIELAPPSLILQRPPKAEELAFSATLILLGLFGAAWSFVSSFALDLMPVTLVLYTLFFTALFFTVFQLNRYRGVLLLFLVFLLGAAGYTLRALVIQGFLITTNRIMVSYANHSNYVLPIYHVAAEPESYALCGTVFALFVLAFVAMVLCWGVIRKQSAAIVIAVTLPFPLSALVFNIVPSFPSLLMLLTCWASLLFIHIMGGSKQVFTKKRRAYRAKSPAAAAKSGLHLLPALILSFLLILSVFPMQSYQYSGKAMELRNRIMNTTTNLSLLDNGSTLAGSSDRVSLRGADSIRFTGKTMLQVQTLDADDKNPFVGYLKGFTGGVYTGTSWEPISDSDYAQVGGKLNGINVQNLSSKLLGLFNFGDKNPFTQFGVHVKNVGGNKKCIYTPYDLTTQPDQISGVNFVRDETIRSGWLFGTGEYSLYANRLKQNNLSVNTGISVPELLAYLYDHIQPKDDQQRQELLQELQQFLTKERVSSSQSNVFNSALLKPSLSAYYTKTLPENLLNAMDDQAKNYLTAEQNYRLFAYDKYTALPEEVRSKMTAFLNESGLTANVMTNEDNVVIRSLANYQSVDDIVAGVKGLLQSRCTYSLTPGIVPAGKDFTEYFLNEKQQGYCVHFATAATVLLRAMGIPARYAEGYMVTNDDYKGSTDGWATVKDSHAHAWVEVYKVGFGWQPYEMTPGFSLNQSAGQSQNPEDETSSSSTPASSSASAPQSGASQSTPASSSQGTSSAPGGAAGRFENTAAVWVPFLMILASFVLLCLIFAVRRRIALRRRARRFTQPDRNRAAIAIYGYLQKLERFGAEIPESFTELAWKARFSQHKMTAEELNEMRMEAEQTLTAVWNKASKTTRFAIRYLFNLN